MKRPERTEREAAALRANLLKRKHQARQRAAAEEKVAEAPNADKDRVEKGTNPAARSEQ